VRDWKRASQEADQTPAGRAQRWSPSSFVKALSEGPGADLGWPLRLLELVFAFITLVEYFVHELTAQ
jgi:hypothetical protein